MRNPRDIYLTAKASSIFNRFNDILQNDPLFTTRGSDTPAYPLQTLVFAATQALSELNHCGTFDRDVVYALAGCVDVHDPLFVPIIDVSLSLMPKASPQESTDLIRLLVHAIPPDHEHFGRVVETAATEVKRIAGLKKEDFANPFENPRRMDYLYCCVNDLIDVAADNPKFYPAVASVVDSMVEAYQEPRSGAVGKNRALNFLNDFVKKMPAESPYFKEACLKASSLWCALVEGSPCLVDIAIDSLLNIPRQDIRSGAYHAALFPALEQVLDKVKDMSGGVSMSVSWIKSFCQEVPDTFEGSIGLIRRATLLCESLPFSPDDVFFNRALHDSVFTLVRLSPDSLQDPVLSDKLRLCEGDGQIALLFNPQAKRDANIPCVYIPQGRETWPVHIINPSVFGSLAALKKDYPPLRELVKRRPGGKPKALSQKKLG